MGHGLSPGRGTEKQGGGLKYASVAPETTRACGLALILIPIKLSLASPCLAPFAEILPRRPLPRPLADTHGNTFRHSHNRYIRTALALYRPPLAANPLPAPARASPAFALSLASTSSRSRCGATGECTRCVHLRGKHMGKDSAASANRRQISHLP